MNGMRNGRTADGGNGDGVIENGTETGTLGDESADGTNSPVTTGEEDGGTNWAAIWIAIIIAVALVAVIVALIPKRRNG